jgi:hypothetical protein
MEVVVSPSRVMLIQDVEEESFKSKLRTSQTSASMRAVTLGGTHQAAMAVTPGVGVPAEVYD